MDFLQWTNASFPEVLDTDNPAFFTRLEKCADANQKLAEIAASDCPAIIKFFQKVPPLASIAWNMLRIYLAKPVNAEALREAESAVSSSIIKMEMENCIEDPIQTVQQQLTAVR